MNGFAVNPTDPKVMYVAMRDGLYTSPDAGETWKLASKQLRNLAAVAVNPRRPEKVYAATADGVVFRSTDAGTTWSRAK